MWNEMQKSIKIEYVKKSTHVGASEVLQHEASKVSMNKNGGERRA